MTVTEFMQSLLVAGPTVAPLVPANRIKTSGNHQNLARPYIMHFPVSCIPIQTHDGLAALRTWDYQISVFADSFASGEAAAHAARDDVIGVHPVGSPVTDGVQIFWQGVPFYLGREDDTGIEHFVVTLRVVGAL